MTDQKTPWVDMRYEVYNKDPSCLRIKDPKSGQVWVVRVTNTPSELNLIERYNSIDCSAPDHDDLVAWIAACLRSPAYHGLKPKHGGALAG